MESFPHYPLHEYNSQESHVQLCIMGALLVPAVHYGRSISAPHTVHVNMNNNNYSQPKSS